MTEEEVNKLSVLELPPEIQETAYEHIEKYFTCPRPECNYEKLIISKMDYHDNLGTDVASDNIIRELDERAIKIYAAGCPKCKTLYRFEEYPIIRRYKA